MQVTLRAILVISIGMVDSVCPAREIVVEPQGDYVSVSKAANEARPSDMVTIRDGVYREEVRFEGKKGTAAKPILVRADPYAPPGTVVLDGSHSAPAEVWQRFISKRFGVLMASVRAIRSPQQIQVLVESPGSPIRLTRRFAGPAFGAMVLVYLQYQVWLLRHIGDHQMRVLSLVRYRE